MWTAEYIGTLLQQPAKNIVPMKEKSGITENDKIVGFVFPTYMGDIPWFVKAFLLKLHLDEKAYCFAIMTSNNGKSGKAFDSIDKALNTNGAKLSFAFDLQMPGNCIESSEKQNKERLQAADSRVEEAAGLIRKRTVNYHSGRQTAPENFVENSYFYGTHSLKRLTIMNQFSVKSSCTGCGICEKLCPMGNITIRDKMAVHGDQCAACYACLHWCPVHATLPKFLPFKYRKQYTHPQITLKHMMESQTQPE